CNAASERMHMRALNWRRVARWLTCAGLVLVAASVAVLFAIDHDYPIRNREAARIAEDRGYRWDNLDSSGLEDTLVIVTASGGGTRATALTLSLLRALGDIRLSSGATLAQEVDLISSVSGGSVAAAYFALK